MMGKFAIVFFASAKNPTADVIPLADITGNPEVGKTVKVNWHGRNYKAKILYIGSKDLCEDRVHQVLANGELLDDDFEVVEGSSCSSNAASSATPPLENLVAAGNKLMTELVTRIGEVKTDMIPCNFQEETRLWQRQIKTMLEEILLLNKEILRKLPASSEHISTDTLEYVYVPQSKVEQLRALRSGNINQFALDLEKAVYGDHPDLCLHVEKRLGTADRMNFIEKCVYKYYHVPMEARKATWRAVKVALNSRARHRRRMQERTQDSTPSRGIVGGRKPIFNDHSKALSVDEFGFDVSDEE